MNQLRRFLTAICLLGLLAPARMTGAATPAGLVYSGRTHWDATTGTLTFETDGTMPDTKEGFYWHVPPEVRRIVLQAGVTVRGGFRVPYRKPDDPLRIEGKDRDTSVLYGTDEEKWTSRNRVPENEKWKYGAINVLADAVVYVTNLTSRNPRSYNISGYANHSVLHVSRCRLVDTRPGDNNNSDGFAGAAGSTLVDTFISTSDDAIKVYRDMTVRNVTVEQRRNGAPIQLGWGGEPGPAKVIIENLTIRGVDPQGLYNMAPFTWENGDTGTREIWVRGLTVRIAGKLYDEARREWRPVGLFELKPQGCTLNLTITDADTAGLAWGIRNTRGVITANGTPL